MPREWTPSDAAQAEDDRRDREWFRKPDPYDPANEPDETEAELEGQVGMEQTL